MIRQRGNSQGEDTVTILLFDDHMERTGPLYQELVEETVEGSDSPRRGMVKYRGKLVWDSYEVGDLVQSTLELEGLNREQAMNEALVRSRKARHLILGDLPDDFDEGTNIAEVWGTRDGMGLVFEQLLEVFDEPLGGDDDAFDYWPNGMRTLIMLAHDLDEIGWGPNAVDPTFFRIDQVKDVVDARRQAFNEDQIAQGRTPEERIDFDTEVFSWDTNA